jgi:hypothetical protein
MAPLISLHEYELRPEVPPAAFEGALREAVARGLFELPGLQGFHFLRGIKGARRGRYAALWIYKNREAWEEIWGPVDRPKPREEFPPAWRIWEDEILAPLLAQDPHSITYTAYEVWLKSAGQASSPRPY